MTCRTRHLARLGDAGWGAHRVLVDSSKTAWRLAAVPFLLARELGQDFQLLHLVRDPRSLLVDGQEGGATRGASGQGGAPRFRRGRLVDRESRLRAVRSDLSAPYQRVHYEDVARAPCDAMRDMFAKILPGMAWPADGIGISDTRHQLYGNRMRRGNLSLGEVREDAGWQRGHARWRSRDRLAAHSTAPLALWLCAREDSRSSR